MLPLAGLFFALASIRRLFYRKGWLSRQRLPVPVIVIGNITVGGAGKTPLTLCLVQAFQALGRRPGVISRGYGGQASQKGHVLEVTPASAASQVGDEPVLMRQRLSCPLFVGKDRVAAGRALLAAYPDCDLLVCDDGLQHYRLARDAEVAVLDRRGIGNGWPLPAGPLREPVSRLGEVTALVANAWPGQAGFRMHLAGDEFCRLADGRPVSRNDLPGPNIHAVAGIGEPQRFFDHLAALGIQFVPHAFADHHAYTAGDFDFMADAILVTEKDAVKLRAINELNALPIWVLPVTATVTPDLARFLLEKLHGCPPA